MFYSWYEYGGVVNLERRWEWCMKFVIGSGGIVGRIREGEECDDNGGNYCLR
jgi:hypothetical protein